MHQLQIDSDTRYGAVLEEIQSSSVMIQDSISRSSTALSTDLQAILAIQRKQNVALQEQKLSLEHIAFLVENSQKKSCQTDTKALSFESVPNRYFNTPTGNYIRAINLDPRLDISSCNCSPKQGILALSSRSRQIFSKESEKFHVHDRSCPIW